MIRWLCHLMSVFIWIAADDQREDAEFCQRWRAWRSRRGLDPQPEVYRYYTRHREP